MNLINDNNIPFRHECGISKPAAGIRNADRNGIVSSVCLHFVLLATKAELDQGSSKELTAMILYDMLPGA